MTPFLGDPTLQAVFAASAAAAVAIPAVFVGVRQSTKRFRQSVVADLSAMFETGSTHSSSFLPSFEFVKYKYRFSVTGNGPDGRPYKDFQIVHWFLGGVPLALVLFVLNVFSLCTILHAGFKVPFPGTVSWLAAGTDLPLFAWVSMAGYVGGLLFMLRAFKQAVNNFDMSPLSLVGAIVNLAFGLAAALLLAFTLLRIPHAVSVGTDASTFLVAIGTAFAAGYYPDVTIRQLMRLSRLRDYKTWDSTFYSKFKAVPIDLVDGIETEIRTRLSDYHILSMQNLATANPLMLFVETPYGVYEIMDWVAQAQLFCSVGAEGVIELWKLGIRTIFDLERIVTDERCRDKALLEQIGDALWNSSEYANARRPGPPAPAGAEPDLHPPLSAVMADIVMRLENPHARRLRQIFSRVNRSLGVDTGGAGPRGAIRPTRSGFTHRCCRCGATGWRWSGQRPTAGPAARLS